jgi:hypothetical protein
MMKNVCANQRIRSTTIDFKTAGQLIICVYIIRIYTRLYISIVIFKLGGIHVAASAI